MQDSVELHFCEERFARSHIGLDEAKVTLGDSADSLQGRGAAVGEVVQHHDVMARGQERDDRVAADETGAARDQQLQNPNPTVTAANGITLFVPPVTVGAAGM